MPEQQRAAVSRPETTTRLAEFKAQHRLARLERGMSDLAEEWGDAVKSPPE